MRRNTFITSEICNVRNARGLLAFSDKLSAATANQYASIHAQGETDANGKQQYSRIGLQMQDYSAGAGKSNVITSYNLTPDFIRYLFTQVANGIAEFEYRQSKICGEPDADGLCKAQTIAITRHALAHDGTPATNPWRFQVVNGRGIKAKSRTGGSYMQAGSFRKEKETTLNMTDIDLYCALSKVCTYITLWEQSIAPQLILDGRQLYERFLNSYTTAKQGAPAAPQYGDGRTPAGEVA